MSLEILFGLFGVFFWLQSSGFTKNFNSRLKQKSELAKLRLPGLPVDGAEAEDALLTSAPSHKETFSSFSQRSTKSKE